MGANNYFVDTAKNYLDYFSNIEWLNPDRSESVTPLPIFDSPLNGMFGITPRGYSGEDGVISYKGTQANAKRGTPRRKQGLFDLLVQPTGDKGEGRYRTPKTKKAKKATHRDLFADLLRHSTEENCLDVWAGENPIHVGESDEEREALVSMFMMMLEQEINWGEMDWQKRTNFWPGTYAASPAVCRPRDMIMGFARQSFRLGADRFEDGLKYWMFSFGRPPTTSDFSSRDDGCGSWGEYILVNPPEARLFTELSDISETARVMDNGVELEFAEEAERHPDNPGYRTQ